jgi:hypothetical protein
MELLLGFVCKPGALATLVGTSLVIGVAISGTILMLP